MRILLWHVHGSWTTAFVQGGHDYVVPVTPTRDADGLGRARTWTWPANVVELPPEELRDADLDVVVLQRPHEVRLVREWTGCTPGVDLPAVYLEHNAPGGNVPCSVHPLAGQTAIPIAHVTHFNRLLWDSGRAPATVIEHGAIDPGYRYTGELDRAAVASNEPARRGRYVGTDLLDELSRAMPIDLFGMGASAVRLPGGGLTSYDDLPQARLHDELPRRRVYLHTTRWTSLGLSLVEAMLLGMPVVALATTETPQVVPPEAGVVSNDLDVLTGALRRLAADPDEARERGRAARAAALARFGLDRFLAEWDELLKSLG